MQQNNTDPGPTGRTNGSPRREGNGTREAKASMERIRRMAVTQRIHDLQASIKSRTSIHDH